MYLRKTMVLSALDNGQAKAVLNIENNRDKLSGSVRLYNFKGMPGGVLTLGILVGGKVYKAGLTSKGTDLYTFETSQIENMEKFSCALINIHNGKASPLLLGSADGNKIGAGEIRLASGISVLDEEDLSVANCEKALDDAGIDFDDEEKTRIESEIDEGMKEEDSCDKCLHCKYREAFYNEGTTAKLTKTPILKVENSPEIAPETFYEEIKDQITALFEKFPEETFLVEIIPGSKWVKVDYEESGEYYVVGLIYENSSIKYVCYGLPGIYSPTPPSEMFGRCQWLPLDPEKPEEFGYWLMYQDAESGESVEVVVS